MYADKEIVTESYKLSYKLYSGGERYLFLFHGFGQSSSVFETFISYVSSEFTVISIDLFFHGKSIILDEKENVISFETWNAIFDKLLKRYSISRFSMLSFSIGARFIISVFQDKKSAVDSIVLIAPDGFGNNIWFTIATSTIITRSVFKWSLSNPAIIRFLTGTFNFLGITDSVTKRFIEKNIETTEQRTKIYNTWVYFRMLKMPAKQFIEELNSSDVKLMCLVGMNDELVAKENIRKICMKTDSIFIELDYPHYKMIQATELIRVREFLISNRK